ncbi:MAG: hypothetical protein AB7N73_12275 [Gemmatimonadales bacterium]|jgi:hypothetical protein
MTIPAHAPGAPVITAATNAILSWQHRRGGIAHCLLRIRTLRTPDADDTATVVVVSQLRDNPRGLGIRADFAGAANAAAAQLLPAACRPTAVRWYAHYGQFSTYDPAGPDTLEEVTLDHDGTAFAEPTPERYRMMSAAETAAATAALHLEPVDELLAAWPWDTTGIPAPRPGE